MADILVNSVYYHLKEYTKKYHYPALNSKQAIELHPLKKLVLCNIDENNKNSLPWFSDYMYNF